MPQILLCRGRKGTVMNMGDNLDNIRMLDAKVGNRKMRMLLPALIPMIFLFILLFVTMRIEGEYRADIWGIFGFLLTMYIIIAVMFFVVSRTGPDFSISDMTPDERARVNADCLTGYRFGEVIICRDCLLVPAAGARVSAVHFRDLLWIYIDKKWIRYATRKNGLLYTASCKNRFFPKNLGPELDEAGFYNVMQRFLPWCFFGKTPEVNALFRKNFPGLVQAVDGRRAAFFASQSPAPFGNMQ